MPLSHAIDINSNAISSFHHLSQQVNEFREAASDNEICVPKGLYLKRLLDQYLTDKDQLDVEIRNIIEKKLIPWGNEILG